jgi:hypothetical protein
VRRVACFAASSSLKADEVPDEVVDSLVAVVSEWLLRKGAPNALENRYGFKLKGGRDAVVERSNRVASMGRVCDIGLEEESEAGRFFTRICVGYAGSEILLFAELRAGAIGYRIAPMSLDVRCPQVVRDLLSKRRWMAGRTPILPAPIVWHGEDSARRFIALLRHADRNLPIVCASRDNGRAITPTICEDLAYDLCGLCLVVDLDEGASWGITKQIGKEWSCYSGALRVYWPIRGAGGSAFDHPLWKLERLMAQADSAGTAASKIRAQLRRRIFALSTLASDEQAELRDVRECAAREEFERVRREAEERGDQVGLAEHYFSECARLEGVVTQLREENGKLTDQVQSYSQAWRYTEGDGSREEIEPEPDTPVATVAEAVGRASEGFSRELIFGRDVANSIKSLAESAGPPDKVYEYLKTLAEMTEVRRNGGLGKDLIVWLRERGINASGESETIRNSTVEMRRRTWDDGEQIRQFEKHLKPSDGTSPDKCVRIYFEYDESRKVTIVGYVGRHL